MNKSTIKNVLALIGGLWVANQVIQYLNDLGILHLVLPVLR